MSRGVGVLVSCTFVVLYITLLAIYADQETYNTEGGPYHRFQSTGPNSGSAIMVVSILHTLFFASTAVRFLWSRDWDEYRLPPRTALDGTLAILFMTHALLSIFAFATNCQGFVSDRPCFHYTTPLMAVLWFWFFMYLTYIVSNVFCFLLSCCAYCCCARRRHRAPVLPMVDAGDISVLSPSSSPTPTSVLSSTAPEA